VRPDHDESLEPTLVDLSAQLADLPEKPLRQRQRRGADDRRPETYRLPAGPFRPIVDPGEATVVEAPARRGHIDRGTCRPDLPCGSPVSPSAP
jgi:hypothetical protein